jgi:hypothetical protein
MIDTTILGKQHAIQTLRLEPRSSSSSRQLVAAAIFAVLAALALV